MSTAKTVVEILEQTVIAVTVKPGAAKTLLLGVRGDGLHLAIAAPPEDGKANRVLEKFLSKETGKACRVVSGFGTRKKLVRCE